MKKLFILIKGSPWASALVISVISTILIACSIVTSGRNNVVEDAAEEVLEHELHLPQGTIDKIIDDIESDGDSPK